LVAVIDTFQE
jgi:hypothetical protein